MRRAFAFVFVAAVALFAIGPADTPAQGKAEKAPNTAPGEFEGKYLYIVQKRGTGPYMEKVQLKKLGDSYFLAGIGFDTGVKDIDWQKGIPVWVAVNEIAEITVFSSKTEFAKVAKSFIEKLEKK